MANYEKDKVWMFSSSPQVGKWYLSDSMNYIKKLFPKVNKLVRNRVAYSAKYSHKKDLSASPLPFDLPVLCVFCEDSNKDQVLEELVKIGTKREDWKWKYNSETRKDWKEGGELYERSKRQKRAYLALKLQEEKLEKSE